MNMAETANALLVDHAAGTLPEALSLVVATHVALNSEARAKYDALNQVGGVMLEGIRPAELGDNALDAVMAAIDATADTVGTSEPGDSKVEPSYDSRTRALVPQPLRSYLPDSLDKLKWKKRGGGVAEVALELGSKQHKASLLKIEPGRTIPSHTHRGSEYTVILDGAYTEGDTRVGMGDMAYNDSEHTHSPVADPQDGCLCLAVTDAPLKFTGVFGWVVNPFIRH